MSIAANINAASFKPSVTAHFRQAARPRLGRTQLSVHAVTNWLLEPKNANTKGKPLDLTEACANKSIASVKSGGGGDFELNGLEGLNLEFRSEGSGQAADAPADLYIKDLGSQVEVTLDGKSLEKNKEYKLSVGQTLKIGDDAIYQILRDTRAHA